MHRLIPAQDPRYIPSLFMPARAAALLLQGRDASYRLYEFTIVTFLALSGIEFLLRTWAQRQNTTAGPPIALFKANGQPNGVDDWIADLVCTPAVRDAVKELYDSKGTNIRNRALHGNLLEIHAKRLEVHLPRIDRRTYGWLDQERDPYHPENIALHALHCLERIDAEASAAGVTAADSHWTNQVMLTADEIEFGARVSCDFLGSDRERWLHTVTDYLNAVMPNLKQLFSLGFVEWLRAHPLNPVLGMVMGFTYEAMHRLTVHLMRANVTGRPGGTVQKSHPQSGAISHFQYRMLDTRSEGLFSPEIIDQIVDHITPIDRATARRVLHLAMKARNALSHGALLQTDQPTLDALGNLFAKASQTLVTAGLHHLIRERAYFIYRDEHPGVHGQDAADWERASREVFDRIARIAAEERAPW